MTEGAVVECFNSTTTDYGTGIPYHEVEALARVLLPEIQAFLQSEEGQREFAEWKSRLDNSNIENKIQGQECFSCPCSSYYIVERNDKSEHITNLENVVRITIIWSGRGK